MMMLASQPNLRLIEVFFAGRGYELPADALGLGASAAEAEILRAVAARLGVPVAELEDHQIDRHPDGSITVRPFSVFE